MSGNANRHQASTDGLEGRLDRPGVRRQPGKVSPGTVVDLLSELQLPGERLRLPRVIDIANPPLLDLPQTGLYGVIKVVFSLVCKKGLSGLSERSGHGMRLIVGDRPLTL